MNRRLFQSTRATFTSLASTWHARTTEVQADGADVRRDKHQVLDEAYDEYCRLREAGDSVAPSEFCNRYPTYRKSLRKLIDVHDTLEAIPDLEQDTWPERGQAFLGFEILHELGVGAIARVYLAAERALGGRFVAVKVSLYGDDEADTLGKLSHPNVVPVHSVQVDLDTGMTAVCMPYLGSATLADVLDVAFGEKVPPQKADVILVAADERAFLAGFIDRAYVGSKTDRLLVKGTYVDGVVHLGVQLAEALAYTHSQGILHRDLKPSNVLLAPSGQPMLLDFNLSCDVQMDVNRVGGTLPYMPPEQIREVHMLREHDIPPRDPRSDIFSLGVILHELLTGRLPFGDPPHDVEPKEAGAMYLEMQQQPPADVRQLNPQVDRQLAETINGCLSQDPEDRPESAADLSALLKRHFAASQRLKRWSYRRRWMLSVAAVLLLGAISVLAYWLFTRPTLDVRLCDSAVIALRRGDHERGLDLINASLDENAKSLRAQFVRARLHHLLRDYKDAVGELTVLLDNSQDPFLLECLAYSLLKHSKYKDAAGTYYIRMILGETAPLLVNAAYSHRFDGQPDFALQRLDRAIELDPNFQPAYHLRAVVRFDQIHRYGDGEQGLAEIEKQAISDINKAVALQSGLKVQHMAAMIKAKVGRGNARYRTEVCRHLKRAVAHGLRKEALTQDPSFAEYYQEERFKELLAKTASRNEGELVDVPNPYVTPPSPEKIDRYLDGPLPVTAAALADDGS